MKSKLIIATVGSHSALDICRGAKEEGFNTMVFCEKGREKTYAKYYKTDGIEGCVDEVIIVPQFKEILNYKFQKKLNSKNIVFIPNRSFEVYVNDYDAIENDFKLKVFGNKKLLRSEERTIKPNQYDILEEAKIRYPQRYDHPKEINKLSIIKVNEKQRGFERAFFLASSYNEYHAISKQLIKTNRISKIALKNAVIEEFVLGTQINFNFFYSAVKRRLELIGTDTRRQTNLDGLLRLPSEYQEKILKKVELKYEESGHIAVTSLESLLEPAYEQGEKFVEATKKLFPPGVIGPFSLQSVVTPGPPKKEIIVFDVSPRMPGSPGIFATPYTNYLFGTSVSMGRRVAMEIKLAIKENKLNLITS